MKRPLVLALTVLSVLTAAQPSFAARAGMDRCSAAQAPLTRSDRAIVLRTIKNTNRVEMVSFDRGSIEKLGEVTAAQTKKLIPSLRYLATGGQTVVYVAATGALAFAGLMVGVGTGGTGFAAGAAEAASVQATVATLLATEAGLQFVDAFNPVAQFERGNVERCLTKQIARSSGSTEAIVIKMNDQDDLDDSKRALIDLAHDLK